MKKILPLLFATVLTSCSSQTEEVTSEENNNEGPSETALYFPPKNSETWETISVESLGWNASAEQELFSFLEERNTEAFIILKDGKIVIEKYFNGATVNTNNPWYSAGKTLTAFLTGIAQEEGLLDINLPSANYMGTGWSNLTQTEEDAITVWHHLTMTSGLDYNVSNQNCTDPECLNYLNDPSDFWYYHNAAYTLLKDIVEGATGENYNDYFAEKIKDPIGMQGAWIQLGFANVYYSNARSMARFGLLNLNKGYWDTTPIMNDTNYWQDMVTTSQSMNESYGYLWWLNGKSSYRTPGLEVEFSGMLVPDAPTDLIAGLGKDDQKLYVVPSQNLVIVRMGGDAGQTLLGPSGFDNELWLKLNQLIN